MHTRTFFPLPPRSVAYAIHSWYPYLLISRRVVKYKLFKLLIKCKRRFERHLRCSQFEGESVFSSFACAQCREGAKLDWHTEYRIKSNLSCSRSSFVVHTWIVNCHENHILFMYILIVRIIYYKFMQNYVYFSLSNMFRRYLNSHFYLIGC